MQEDVISFSFGENWKSYLSTVSQEEIESSRQDIEHWLTPGFAKGKAILDIGSGSGLHSLAFFLSGCRKLVSFDADRHSVEATRACWEKAERPEHWTVLHGSVLEPAFLAKLGTFDLVYSWGVLHHTGDMWQALENSVTLVAPEGYYWISLYAKSIFYEKHLAQKRRYNRASLFGKKCIVAWEIAKRMWRRAEQFKNPLTWNEKKERGMNVYHDIIDWLGGLPYEVAGVAEIIQFGKRHQLNLEKIQISQEGGCHIFLFKRIG